MKKYTVLLCFLASNFTWAEQCTFNPDVVSVTYQKKTTDKELQTTAIEDFTLVRHNNSVAHVNSALAQINMWHKVKNNKVMFTRYFSDVKQAIEYQPAEVKGQFNFTDKFQMLPQAFIKQLELVEENKIGCNTEQTFRSRNGKQRIELVWLKELKLLKRLTIGKGSKETVWRQQELFINAERVTQFYKALADYNVTDYADIGDNENNPVLAKMIYQGFSTVNSEHVQSEHSHEH
ncbi:hypothetical protein [Thalassotalea ganghwensis]